MLIAKGSDGVSGWVLTKNVGKTDQNNKCVFTLIRQTDRITQWGRKTDACSALYWVDGIKR